MTPYPLTADDLHDASERRESIYGDGMAQVIAAGLTAYPPEKVNHAADLWDTAFNADTAPAFGAQARETLDRLCDTDDEYRDIEHTFSRLGQSFRRRQPARHHADQLLGRLPPNTGDLDDAVADAVNDKALPPDALAWSPDRLREWATDTVLRSTDT